MGRSRSLLAVCAGAVVLASIGVVAALSSGSGSDGSGVDLGRSVASEAAGRAPAAGRAEPGAGKVARVRAARDFKGRLERARKRDFGQSAEAYFRRGPQILDEMMQRHEPDEAWAAEVTASAREIFGKPEYRGTTFESVECRGALCRMVLRHSKETAFDYFRGKGSNEEPWDGDLIGTHRHLPDGTIESEVYFSDPSGDPEPFREMREIMQEEQP